MGTLTNLFFPVVLIVMLFCGVGTGLHAEVKERAPEEIQVILHRMVKVPPGMWHVIDLDQLKAADYTIFAGDPSPFTQALPHIPETVFAQSRVLKELPTLNTKELNLVSALYERACSMREQLAAEALDVSFLDHMDFAYPLDFLIQRSELPEVRQSLIVTDSLTAITSMATKYAWDNSHKILEGAERSLESFGELDPTVLELFTAPNALSTLIQYYQLDQMSFSDMPAALQTSLLKSRNRSANIPSFTKEAFLAMPADLQELTASRNKHAQYLVKEFDWSREEIRTLPPKAIFYFVKSMRTLQDFDKFLGKPDFGVDILRQENYGSVLNEMRWMYYDIVPGQDLSLMFYVQNWKKRKYFLTPSKDRSKTEAP